MSSTYTKGKIEFPSGYSENIGAGNKYDSVVITYPTDTVPYWTVALTCTGKTSQNRTIYTSTLMLITPA